MASQPIDQASILGHGMALQGDYAQQQLQRQLGALQTQNFALQNAGLVQEARKAQTEEARLAEFQSRFAAIRGARPAGFAEGPVPPIAPPDAGGEALSRAGSRDRVIGLIAEFPEFSKELKSAVDLMDDREKQDVLSRSTGVYAAGRNGRYDLGARILKRQIDADKAAGREPDPTDVELMEAYESGDPARQKAAVDLAGFMVASATGVDHFAATTKNLGENDGDFTLSPGSKRFDRDGKMVAEAPFAPRPVSVGEGETVIEYDPNTGGGGPASGGGGGGGSAPLSVRYNNPGALRPDGKSNWQGAVGTENGFLKFDSPENGRRAQIINLQNQRRVHGIKTLSDLTRKYAPSNDGNDPAAYAARVGRAVGIDPNAEIDLSNPQVASRVADAMAMVESGGHSGTVTGGGPRVIAQGAPKQQTRVLTPEEVSAIPGLDPNTVYQQNKDGTITAVSGTRAQLKAWPAPALSAYSTNKASLTNIGNAMTLLDPKNNSPAAKTARKSIGPGTGMLGDTFTQWNDPEGTDFRALIGQIGGLIIKDTSGAAVSLSEDARLAKWVPLVTDTPQAARAKLANLRREIQQRNQSMEETFSEDQGYRSRAGGDIPTVRSIQEAQKLKPGTRFRTPDGRIKVR